MTIPVNPGDVLHARAVDAEMRILSRGWDPQYALHALCAFANDADNRGGGYLVIGVGETDAGEPELPPGGLSGESIERLRLDVERLGTLMRPAYSPVFARCTVEGRHIAVVWAPAGNRRPYKAPLDMEDRREYAYYLRRDNFTRVATNDESQELFAVAASMPFDLRIRPSATIADLSRDRIIAFLRDTRSELYASAAELDMPGLCRQMRMVEKNGELTTPINAALMFFCEHPERFFTAMQTDVAIFPQPDGGRYQSATFSGPLPEQLVLALEYIRANAITDLGMIDPGSGRGISSYPYEAVREVLTNAVRHRRHDSDEPVDVQVLPDQIRITSTPGPDHSVQLAAMADGHVSRGRATNPRVDEFLRKLGLIRDRCTGLRNVRDEMLRNGSPAVRFESDSSRSYLTVVIPVHPHAVADLPHTTPRRTTPQGGSTLGVAAAAVTRALATPDPIATTAGRLLHFCREPRDRRSIQRHLGIPGSILRQEYLDPLVDAGLLAHTDPWHPGTRTERFHTTGAGFATMRRSSSIRH